jgi:hypothetical protein
MFICGLNHEGSSNVPALSHSSSGVATTSLTMAEPHLGQNLRKTGSPLSPTSSKAAKDSPSIRRLPLREDDKDRKGRTRLLLAVPAVARCGQYGFRLALVADAATQTASDDVSHALLLPFPLSSAGSNSFAHPYDATPRCSAHPPVLITRVLGRRVLENPSHKQHAPPSVTVNLTTPQGSLLRYASREAGDRTDVGDPTPLKCLLQALRYERAVPEYHPPHDGGFLWAEPEPERSVRSAVHAADPAVVLVHRPDARCLDDGRDAFGRKIPRA